MQPDADRIRIEIDPDLGDLVPTFLENRRTDIVTILQALALERGDYQSIPRIGHNLRGESGALGFDGLTLVGRGLERAALDQDVASINAEAERLARYLERVDIVPGAREDH
jgi:HPt (histidine-containing phosphotransfer) domain-containing protein